MTTGTRVPTSQRSGETGSGERRRVGVPVALTIAGSDSGGGAGIQADLKTFSALGVFGASAITALTAQNTQGVAAVEPVSPKMVADQIGAVLADMHVGAVKIGMLASAAIVEAVADALEAYDGPVVLDPVMIAKSGDSLLADDAIEALIRHLLPRADLLTPNLPEAARLCRETADAVNGEAVVDQGRRLIDMGARAVLMKGGHASGPTCIDRLVMAGEVTDMRAPRIATRNTHGTGCTLSSAIAAECAKGADLVTACRNAHGWLHRAILGADGLRIGGGQGPVHHFHGIWA